MFKRILVPVDGSDNALRALKLAVGMQKMTGAELMTLTVFRHHSLLEASMSMVRPDDPQNLDDAMREHAKEIADAAKKEAVELGAAGPRAFVRNGPPARTIVKFSKEREVDLIVLGSRGLGDLEGYLMGSVSHKVTSLADCPVMVV
ncbi:universal stress protein [Nitratireductor pacificus]|uniref:Regulatory protein TeaD n=1 Tax=Nitratireductor pacificus pht-3B TaxID=391937 RepID=K2M7G8_9HYPH|nr:universal stress protein [Nitratireductor pacificus]EKF16955.1 regulatory protein TeaD [Nitratireductor pacificus pht-3B]